MLGKGKRLDSCSRRIEPQRNGEGSANLSSEVDSVDGSVSNRKHGIESEDETDKVGEVHERNKEKVGMDECGNL